MIVFNVSLNNTILKSIFSVSAISAFIAVALLTLQSWRRFYETFYVSIFSSSNINVAHYAIGYIHYFGAMAAILVEAPGLTPPSIGIV